MKQLAIKAWSKISRRPEYECKYTLARLRRYWQKRPSTVLDTVFVLPPAGTGGWILDAICREVSAFFPGTPTLVRVGEPIPVAKSYFYPHFMFYRNALLSQPAVHAAKNVVLFTHPPEEGIPREEIVYLLNSCHHVASMCSLYTELLKQWGVAAEKVSTVLLGASPEMFTAHSRGNGDVGFCSAFYARKNPDTIFEIIRQCPHRRFTLLGKNWKAYERFEDMLALPNFRYLELSYAEYPSFYNSIDIFVSPSRLEGGPIPLLESMMSNVFPVATNTGHAPDLIQPERNGFLYDPDASVEEILGLIERAAEDTHTDIRGTVLPYSWKRCADQIKFLLDN
jgi:glycosyltransferase involved in cell wall biosynthesis